MIPASLTEPGERPAPTVTYSNGEVSISDTPPSSGSERVTWSGKTEFLLTAIGFAVGLGNVWRFPYLCYSNGGGAFLIPYTFMLTLAGLPLFFMELAFGQYASLGSITIWRVCPLFKGLGYTMVTVSLMVSLYYNVIIAFCAFYFFASFTSELPWTHCNNTWNSENCSMAYRDINSSAMGLPENNTGALAAIPRKTPSEEYWELFVLGEQSETDIGHLGAVRWRLALCLLFSWTVVFCCICKGIKTSGKVAYFTATFPYLVLLILFFRGVTLSGAGEGIKFYLKPEMSRLRDVKVWKEAAVQILYSLGPGFGGLLTMGSYNKFHNNCYRDAILVTVVNCGTSIFAGFVTFAVLGHMAHEQGVHVDAVVRKGPGLAFVAYPQGLALMPGAPFWSILFFFMLFILGLGSQFPGIQCIVTGITDEFRVLSKHKTLVAFCLCFLLFLLGLPCVTRGGMYVVELIDKFSTSFPLLIVTSLEAVILSWIYGYRRFSDNIETMMGFRPNCYWIACWIAITPLLILVILLFSCIQYEGVVYEDYHYPQWAEAIGWLLSVAALGFIPIWMVIKVSMCVGSCNNLWLAVRRGPSGLKSLNLRSLIEPSGKWGPSLVENKPQQREVIMPPLSLGNGSSACDDDLQVAEREDRCILDPSDHTINFSPSHSYI